MRFDGRMMHRPRILVAQQGCIPIYRKSFFQRLNALGSIEYVVLHGQAPRGTDLILAQQPFDFPNIPVANYEIEICGISCIWQPIVWRAIKGEFDGAVFGDEVKFLSSLFATLALRLRGRPVLLWGFGYHQYKGPPSLRASITATLAAVYKRLLYRIISGYLVYTDGGKQALRNLPISSKRVAVLRNTIDTEREAEFRALVSSEPLDTAFCQLRVRPDSVKLLYFGRLLPNKRVDLLIEFASRCAQKGRKIDVIIFGQGIEEQRLRGLAQNLSNVVFHRHDDLLLARALRISSAVVIPGFVGLAINHGFAHGVPMLTRYGQPHSPEVEYLEDGVNGLMLPEAPEDFFAALDVFVDDRNLRQRLAEGAKRTAHEIDMGHMVTTFNGLVSKCLESNSSQTHKTLFSS
jgi:glycosyltransferase involved in cell wall biosynthesis